MHRYPPDELAARRQKKQAEAHRSTAIPSQHDYERREMDEFRRQLSEPYKASLADRKDACAQFLWTMRHPEIVGEHVGWLLDGSYGYGAMKSAEKVAQNKRMNRAAWMTHTVAALDWSCPQGMAADAWKKLTSSEKQALDAAVMSAIDGWLAEHGGPRGGKHGRY